MKPLSEGTVAALKLSNQVFKCPLFSLFIDVQQNMRMQTSVDDNISLLQYYHDLSESISLDATESTTIDEDASLFQILTQLKYVVCFLVVESIFL